MKTEAYLFVHFKEKYTPDGEQVYFATSRDGFVWEAVNKGEPILTSTQGDCGVRDFCITRKKDNTFVILATDLGLANHFATKYRNSWEVVNREGSKYMSKWESPDLINWSEQKLVKVANDDNGCAWAPDIIYDEKLKQYVVHYSTLHLKDPEGLMNIDYVTTTDFEHYSEPQMLTKRENVGIIDSNIVYADGYYYRFIKGQRIYLERGRDFFGEFEPMPAFDTEMAKLLLGGYEAPTCFQLANGQWCVMLDFYGCEKEKQGYVPFVADDIATGRFIRSDARFFFPYGFKHGTVLPITLEEYNRIREHYGN